MDSMLADRSPLDLEPPSCGEVLRCRAQLWAEAERTALAIEERLQAQAPGWPAGPAFAGEEMGNHLRDSLRALVESFRAATLPLSCPSPDVACAVLAAKVGSLKALLAGYRAIQSGVWRAWLGIVEESGADQAARAELLGWGLEFTSRYAEALRDQTTEIFQATIEQMARDGELRRLHAVRAVLEGEDDPVEQLDLELAQHHLGVIAQGEAGELAIRRLAESLGRPLFVVGPIGGARWAWISGRRPLGLADERLLRGGFVPPAGAQLSIGLEAYGSEGFRSTHKQAIRAQAVGGPEPAPLIYFGEVAVAALSASSPEDARAFVVHELRGIDQETSSDQRIRETILAYFAAGHNAACAAATLGVHQQTVTNRLAAAEERLGRSVASRRVELETALRLRSLLGVSG